MHEFDDPSHCAMGVTICKNSSSDVVISGLPRFETKCKQFAVKKNELKKIPQYGKQMERGSTEFNASKDQIQR